MPMKFRTLILIGMALPLAGCRTAKDVAVTSFRVIDAPAHYIRRHIDEEPAATTTSTTATTYQSDAVTPGTPIVSNSPPPSSRANETVTGHRPTQGGGTETRSSSNQIASHPSNPTPTPIKHVEVKATPEIPYARPVPGKPGYVYSPFDKSGGFVDVTGYKPGSQVKDPYTGRIFLVP
jgi:hypothetical protein